jgi:hypothetical protein
VTSISQVTATRSLLRPIIDVSPERVEKVMALGVRVCAY